MSTSLNTVEYDQTARLMYPLNLTASLATTASFSTTCSFALNGGGGGTTLTTGSTYPITASWATSSVTASVAFALTPFLNIMFSSSLNWITMSFANTENFFSLTNGFAYNFTHSNLPSSGAVAACSLFISNSAAGTSSFSFPSSWVFMGNIPFSLTSSKSAILSLKAYGTSSIVAGFAVQY